MLAKLIPLLSVLLVASCAADYPTRFVANGVELTFTRDDAKRLRSQWKEPTDEVLRASATTEHDRLYALSVIARTHAGPLPRQKPCHDLALSGVRRLPLDEVPNQTSAGTVEVLRPVFFAELWQVEACGKRETWRALGLWSTIHLTRLAGDA